MDPFAYIQEIKLISTLVLGYFCYRNLKKVYYAPLEEQFSQSQQHITEQKSQLQKQSQVECKIVEENNQVGMDEQISAEKEPQNIIQNELIHEQVENKVNQFEQIQAPPNKPIRRIIRKRKQNQKKKKAKKPKKQISSPKATNTPCEQTEQIIKAQLQI